MEGRKLLSEDHQNMPSPPAMPPSICRPTGHSKYLTEFDEINFIAMGGFGVVAKCQSKLDKKIYAVKKISVEYSGFSREKLLREAEIWSIMDHPNIVRYYHVWVEPSMSGCVGEDMLEDEIQSCCIYLLMELCKSSLSEYIVELNEYRAEHTSPKLFCDCLRAVEHIHNKGYIHADIWAGNMFLDEDDNVKLGDFGLALQVDDTMKNVLISNSSCNAKYKAPERKSGEYVDQKIDVFSLGIILAELIHPMKTQFERNEVIQDLKENGPPAEWIDDLYSPIIKRALAADPSDRPTVTEMLEEVERLLEDQTMTISSGSMV